MLGATFANPPKLESTNGVSMNGTSVAGTPNSNWRPIKSNSASGSGVITNSAGAPCLEGPVRRRREQGHGEPGLAQGEGRMGRLGCAFTGRRAGCAAYSRWHGGVVDVRLDHKATAISLRCWSSLACARMVRRSARGQGHGRGEQRRLAQRPRRSDRPQALPPRPSGSLPPTDGLSETTFAVQNPLASGPYRCTINIGPHRCTINMYLICMCWLRRLGTARVSLTLRYRWE
jgi:hypothetical protein